MPKTAAGTTDLLSAWKTLESEGLRQRDAALRLGVTEAELVNEFTRIGAAKRLRPHWQAIVQAVPSLGSVMALTRNASCVIEKTGVYGAPDFSGGHLGQVTGPDIDLRIFFTSWRSGFAVEHGERHSLEFFGPDGQAVHKIHSHDQTDKRSWNEFVTAFSYDGKYTQLTIAQPILPPERPDADVDLAAYRDAIATMSNTHDFFGVMRRFELSREQALRLGGIDFAQPVDARGYRQILEGAAAREVPIMVFVGNPGTIEIHSGPVHCVVEHAGYFNVLDRAFNLHLFEADVARAWVVRKPTSRGIISSLEVYDGTGEMIVQFFGERHAGEAERTDWRALLAELPAEQRA